jgi:hypothetical protein
MDTSTKWKKEIFSNPRPRRSKKIIEQIAEEDEKKIFDKKRKMDPNNYKNIELFENIYETKDGADYDNKKRMDGFGLNVSPKPLNKNMDKNTFSDQTVSDPLDSFESFESFESAGTKGT